MNTRNYWCYRVDTSQLNFFWVQLNEGRLRQGWGWDEKQNLRDCKLDEGAGRNRTMFDRVKNGDILLIPQLPNWGEVALVEATEDWNKGYSFEIDKALGDYGHIFPAKYLKKFTRDNENVTGNLRSTLKNPSRFWNINHYSEDVKLLLETQVTELWVKLKKGRKTVTTFAYDYYLSRAQDIQFSGPRLRPISASKSNFL